MSLPLSNGYYAILKRLFRWQQRAYW